MKSKFMFALQVLIDNAEVDNLNEKSQELTTAIDEGKKLLKYLNDHVIR